MRPRRFLFSLLAMYAMLLAAIIANYAVLWRAGELESLDDMIARQHRDGAIYNALSIAFADYKYAAYRAAAPRIVAIGTSRAMQIREGDFLASFYNLGGLAQGPEQANVLADRLLLRGDPPGVVIFALDFWTFCRPPDRGGERRPVEAASVHDGMDEPQRHFLAYRLLLEGRFSTRDYERLMFSSQGGDKADRIGLGARLGTSGFAADGSIYGAPPEDAIERRWQGMFGRIAAGTDQFAKDCDVSQASLDALAAFVRRMEAAGTSVVLFLAPLPGAVIARLRADGRYAYIGRLRRLLAERYPDRFTDFFDLRDKAPDSEFLDGMHGGEVTYMRIVLAIAQRGPPLSGLVNEGKLAGDIDLWAGHARIETDPITRKFFPNPREQQQVTERNLRIGIAGLGFSIPCYLP